MAHLLKIFLPLLGLILATHVSFAHEPHTPKDKDKQEAANSNISVAQDSAKPMETPEGREEIASTIVRAKWSDFPTLHPLFVHFPIVLLLLAAMAQILALFFWKKELSVIAMVLLAGGFAGAYLVSTLFHPHTGELSNAAQQVLKMHEKYAGYTRWLSGAGLLLQIANYIFFKRKLWLEIIIALVLAGAAFSVSRAGHYGATLVHLYNVGPQGKHLEQDEHEHEHEH